MTISPKTTHIVSDLPSYDENLAKWKAKYPTLTIVARKWVEDSVKQQKRLEPDAFLVASTPVEPGASPAPSPSPKPSPSSAGSVNQTPGSRPSPSATSASPSTTRQPIILDDEGDDRLPPQRLSFDSEPKGTPTQTILLDDDDLGPRVQENKRKRDSHVGLEDEDFRSYGDLDATRGSGSSSSLPDAKKLKYSDGDVEDYEAMSDSELGILNPAAQPNPNNLPTCKYDPNCIRKNPTHFQEFFHPSLPGNQPKGSGPSPLGAVAPKPVGPAPAVASGQPSMSLANLKWTQVRGSSLWAMSSPHVNKSAKVFAFDLDDTLITTLSGKTFAKTRQDWQWKYPEVMPTLQKLHSSGAKIVIFTNQAGVHKGKQKLSDLTGKIEDLAAQLKFPFQAFMATDKDLWRKPNPEMWEEMTQNWSGTITPDLAQCMYVGDAAGRPSGWEPKAKKDFGCSDRKFAHNVGVVFRTPEEFFLKHAVARFEWGSLDPQKYLDETTNLRLCAEPMATLTSTAPEMIIMTARPASGKSALCKKYLLPAGYLRVNRDELQTAEKCVKVAEQALSQGKSVVIDNTNPDVAARAKYIALARKFGVPVRSFWMQTPKELSFHLNAVRERTTKGQVKKIPMVAFHTFEKKFQQPTIAEGFSEVRKINWVPSFATLDNKAIFLQFTEQAAHE